jgi:hypothetical protein
MGARTGISVGLILVVAAVLLVARIGGSSRNSGVPYRGSDEVPTITSTVGDDAQVAPTQSAYADNELVRSATMTFMTAWLRREATPESWHAGVAALATRQLADSLIGVDPVGVPATRMTGDPKVVLRSDLYAQVNVAVDSGMVVLGLLKQDDRWLVDSIDWERT